MISCTSSGGQSRAGGGIASPYNVTGRGRSDGWAYGGAAGYGSSGGRWAGAWAMTAMRSLQGEGRPLGGATTLFAGW